MNYNLIVGLLAILFFASCAKDNEGMTSNGFKYKVLPEGSGVKPEKGDYIFFHVDMISDGEVQFDSRLQGQETALQLTDEAKGNIINRAMNECLAHVSEGDSMIMYVNIDSLRAAGMALPDSTKELAYRLRITDILDEEEYIAKQNAIQAEQQEKAAAIMQQLPQIESFVQETYQYIVSGRGREDIKTTDSGLQYIVHEKGTGEKLEPGDMATVQYYGILKENGKEFDNSWKRGAPFSFALGRGQVIPGWDEGVSLLNKGDKVTLIIPSHLGYGAAGSPPVIPENADLIFYIEVPNE